MDEFMESADITQMEGPVRSLDLIRIEHGWDVLGRAIATRKHPLRVIQGLKTELRDESDSPGTDERGLLISVGATAPKETSAPLSLRSNDEMIGRRWSNDKPRDRCRGGSAGCQGATARGFGWRICLRRCLTAGEALSQSFGGRIKVKAILPVSFQNLPLYRLSEKKRTFKECVGFQRHDFDTDNI
ncbi:hypothetical protein TNCV_2109811 [Trichonephila clavipes]|nr:hypothetical protein TNCV_2109811 [Trichonephila clavipes]